VEGIIGEIGQHLVEESPESLGGYEGVTRAIMDMLGDQGDVVNELVGIVDDFVGELANFYSVKGIGVLAGLSGVEVTFGGAGAAGTERVVEVGAAVDVVSHRPGFTARYLTAAFVGISGHDDGYLKRMVAHMFY